MIAISLNTLIGKLACALLFFALVFAPMACAENCDQLAETVRSLEPCSDHISAEETDTLDHEHHVHNCSGCCMSPTVLGSTVEGVIALPAELRPPFVVGASGSPPGHLFRPPRV